MRYRFLLQTVSELANEISNQWIPESDLLGDSLGNNFGGCTGQSSSDIIIGNYNATVLLPLCLRVRQKTLHEDVRAAAIRKSLVGHFLSQEKLNFKRIVLSCVQSGVKENKSP